MEGPNHSSPLTACRLLTPDLIEAMGILDMPCWVLGRQSPPTHVWFRYCRSSSSGDAKRDVIEPISGIPRSLLDIFSGIYFGATEKEFWDWPGELGNFDHIQLWEAYRCAGILSIRHRDRKTPGNKPEPPTNTGPRSDVLVNRLLSCIDAIFRRKPDMSEDEAFIFTAFLYPLFIAGSELESMHENPGWKAFIEHVFVDELITNAYQYQSLKVWDLLREMWKGVPAGSAIDANELALEQGLELGLL